MSFVTGEITYLSHTRSTRKARNTWGLLVDLHGERNAFTQLAERAGGSDAAFRVLARHGIGTDLS
jgi:hypothetical protein